MGLLRCRQILYQLSGKPKLQQTQPQLSPSQPQKKEKNVVTDQKVSEREEGAGTHVLTERIRNRRSDCLQVLSLSAEGRPGKNPVGGKKPSWKLGLLETMLLLNTGQQRQQKPKSHFKS